MGYLRLAWICGLVTTACAPLPTYEHREPFAEEEFTLYAGEGTAAIRGVTAPEGRKDVFLVPATAYLAEWYWNSVERGNKPAPDLDHRASRHIKMVASTKGEFVFEKLPPGTYYILNDGYYAFDRPFNVPRDRGYKDDWSPRREQRFILYATVEPKAGETIEIEPKDWKKRGLQEYRGVWEPSPIKDLGLR